MLCFTYLLGNSNPFYHIVLTIKWPIQISFTYHIFYIFFSMLNIKLHSETAEYSGWKTGHKGSQILLREQFSWINVPPGAQNFALVNKSTEASVEPIALKCCVGNMKLNGYSSFGLFFRKIKMQTYVFNCKERKWRKCTYTLLWTRALKFGSTETDKRSCMLKGLWFNFKSFEISNFLTTTLSMIIKGI